MISDKSNPGVSIVFTVYNSERYIMASVQAALSQDYPNFEVIVLDDGSIDKTEEICRSIRDTRLRYIKRERLGRQRALNEAISVASGEFIAINDADDLSFPHRLRYSLDFFSKHQNVAYLGTAFARTSRFFERLPENIGKESESQNDILPVWPSRIQVFQRNPFNNSTLVFPKSTWKLIGGYDESLSLNEDYDFYLRAMQVGQAVLLPRRTVLWYTNPEGIFKQRSISDYLDSLTVIKKRAFNLLRLPLWMKPYYPIWRCYFKILQYLKKFHYSVNMGKKTQV
jgi:glycosyltransferase involved in cell wall biosynthesis